MKDRSGLESAGDAQVAFGDRVYGRQAVAQRHAVEAVQEFEGRFLVVQRVLMRVVAFRDPDAIGVPKALVERAHLSE
jgi:hypothetical protein